MYWLNGGLVQDVSIDPSDRGFTLGDGLFETFAVKAAKPMDAFAHLARLADGLRVLGIPMTYGSEELNAAMHALLTQSEITQGSLRLTVTRGPAPRGVLPPARPSPTWLISAAPALNATPGPVRLIIASCTRRNEFSPLSRIKSLNYLDNVLARQEAQVLGADDAVLLNSAGRATETSIANLFLAVGGIWLTAPVSEGVLPGIARARILASCPVAERPISVQDMQCATAAIVTNSLSLRAVAALDGRDLEIESDLFTAAETVLR